MNVKVMIESMRNTNFATRSPKHPWNVLGIVLLLMEYINLISSRLPTDDMYVSNLTPLCMRCLCYAATNCDLTIGCVNGYCGPYKISRVYWADAGRLVMPDDDPDRSGAFEDCTLHIECAQGLIKNYMAKYGRDCNNDGVTDCTDFSMIHFNGGWQCSPSLTRNEAGRNWTVRYAPCSPTGVLGKS